MGLLKPEVQSSSSLTECPASADAQCCSSSWRVKEMIWRRYLDNSSSCLLWKLEMKKKKKNVCAVVQLQENVFTTFLICKHVHTSLKVKSRCVWLCWQDTQTTCKPVWGTPTCSGRDPSPVTRGKILHQSEENFKLSPFPTLIQRY